MMEPNKDLRKHPHSNSIKIFSKFLRENYEVTNKSSFIPFLNERDHKGKLLGSQTDRLVDTRRNSTNLQARLTKKQPNNSNVAFLTTKNKSVPRVIKKINNTLPVGLYNPKILQEIKSSPKLPTFRAEKFSSVKEITRSQSIDYVDMGELFRKNIQRVQEISIAKQLPRHKQKKSTEGIEKFLIPRTELPDYLKKFKGLYHIGELGKSTIYPVPKDFSELSKNLNEKISMHIDTLKNIANYIKTYGAVRV